ncbi:aldo/keto reductase family domain-containing protein [Phthorimaea operculella]|nr:aldo/keto reductase family domain-containing protein [Phthorimaea operculella]
MDTKRVLRPNPNWEEDLERATVMEDDHVARVLSYPQEPRRKKKEASPKNPFCKCEVAPKRGVAPVFKLSSGKDMPGFALGTWLGADASGMIPVTDYSVYHAVMWAIDAGYRHIDTAAIYDTEKLVGQAINAKINQGVINRNEIFVTTKLWNNAHARDAVLPALRKSLENLGLTYVDLYLIHWPTGQLDDGTFDNTDHLETWRGMQEARDQGLTKSIGVSNFNLQQLERLVRISYEKPAVLQVEVAKTFAALLLHPESFQINLNLQQPELLTFCCEHGIAVMAYTPFGSLFPSRASPDAPPPRAHERTLVEIGEKYGKTVPQVVLRYLVELGVVPIPKSVTKDRIEENIQVFDFKLTPGERKLLKRYDVGYRTIAPEFLEGSPFYPFEKK